MARPRLRLRNEHTGTDCMHLFANGRIACHSSFSIICPCVMPTCRKLLPLAYNDAVLIPISLSEEVLKIGISMLEQRAYGVGRS